ncbi:hypothetical protein Tcan_11055 [Toxocara canis]|uniref:Uncharacterized protein n=1 Tax=Toxocara canis TaxID=6265 RepID=A0A0B2UVY1_TOXCA|nr:hypothetical protein Tcan_11055 [Toxocara canis]
MDAKKYIFLVIRIHKKYIFTGVALLINVFGTPKPFSSRQFKFRKASMLAAVNYNERCAPLESLDVASARAYE